jgi:hypothetical protein
VRKINSSKQVLVQFAIAQESSELAASENNSPNLSIASQTCRPRKSQLDTQAGFGLSAHFFWFTLRN